MDSTMNLQQNTFFYYRGEHGAAICGSFQRTIKAILR